MKIKINISIKLYIFSYGIGVFVLEDDLYPMKERYAVDYCEYRKKTHNNILNFCHEACSVHEEDSVKEVNES